MTSRELVEIIEAELKRKRISKGDFYKACGITSGHMSNWRRGLNYPQTPTLVRISDYLGTNLMGARTNNPATDNGDGDERTTKREEINRLLDAAPDWLQEQIYSLLKAEESGRTSQGGDPKAR